MPKFAAAALANDHAPAIGGFGLALGVIVFWVLATVLP